MNKDQAKKKYEEDQRRRTGDNNFTCSINDSNFLLYYATIDTSSSCSHSHSDFSHSSHDSSSYDSGSCGFD